MIQIGVALLDLPVYLMSEVAFLVEDVGVDIYGLLEIVVFRRFFVCCCCGRGSVCAILRAESEVI